MKSTLLIVCAILVTVCFAHEPCGYQQHRDSLLENNPELTEKYYHILDTVSAKIRQSTHKRAIQEIIQVPIVFHILYNDNVAGTRISMSAIQQELIFLNQWYTATNANYRDSSSFFEDDIATASDFEIEFVLASFDPNGEPTNGVVYTETNLATCSVGDTSIFSSSSGGSQIWDSRYYVNVYTCDLTFGIVGYATFPGSPRSTDGVVLDISNIGNSEFSGSTFAHELGHYFGLRHTFGDGNGCGSDGIDDTPQTDIPGLDYVRIDSACPGIGGADDSDFERCGNEVMIQNCMDYNYEKCIAYFSKDQAKFIREMLESSDERSLLRNSPGLSGNQNTDVSVQSLSPVSPVSPISPISPISPVSGSFSPLSPIVSNIFGFSSAGTTVVSFSVVLFALCVLF